jgi:glycosyltransferase involved in cell wall biosynthesis
MLLENQTYPRDVRVRNEARALVRRGDDVTVIAPRGPGEPATEVVDGVSVWRYRLPFSSGGVAGFLAEYLIAHLQLFIRAGVALARGATVLHLHNPPDTLFPVALVARLLRRKVVFDNHDLSPELFRTKFGPSPALERVLGIAQGASFRVASAVLVTNASQREVALRQGARPESVTIVRNGPARATLTAHRAPRPGVLHDPLLVFVGELDSQDGVLSLASLLQSVREQPETEGARMLVVGDGARRRELEARVRTAGLQGVTHLTGRVDHARIPELLAAADVCVDPAPCSPLNHRSTMIKVAEYLAAGRPVVAYGLVETKRTAGEAALYARCGDERDFARHVGRLARDDELRRTLGLEGRRRARELVWEHSERRLIEVYGRL